MRADAAAGGGETAVALDQAVGGDACEAFEVVDVLGVICLQAALVLQGADESVGRGVSLAVFGEDLACERVEGLRVFVEVEDVEDFFRLAHAHRPQAGVEACVFGSEVRDAERGGDSGACDDEDFVAGLQELGGVVDGVDVLEFLALVGDVQHDTAEEAQVLIVGDVDEF